MTEFQTAADGSGGGHGAEALGERLIGAILGVGDLVSIYLGDRLGWYQALHRGGPLTAAQLAAQTGTNARYAREWLEQQAACDLLTVEEAAAEADARRYALPAGHAEVLLDVDSLNYLAPLGRFVAGMAAQLPALLTAYRTGGGVPYGQYGPDVIEAQAAMNRPVFLSLLGSEWLPQMADIHARLQAAPPARVADIGCGAGWSCIGMAQAYPTIRVDGYDADPASVALARENVAAAGLQERVQVRLADAAEESLSGAYDLVVAFETIHDMSRPVEALASMRRLAGRRGAVVVMDENVAEEFTPNAGPFERFFYAASLLLCLPAGMAEQPSAGTGTVMRASTLRGYARSAGFREMEILPIEHPFFRFYRLHA